MSWLANFMRSRYGKDTLSVVMAVAGLILGIIARIFGLWYIALPAVLLVVLALMRVLSTDIPKRHSENQKFIWAIGSVKRFFGELFRPIRKLIFRLKDDEHRYFRCRKCGQELRVPTGKGRIEITCPSCKNKFIKKT